MIFSDKFKFRYIYGTLEVYCTACDPYPHQQATVWDWFMDDEEPTLADLVSRGQAHWARRHMEDDSGTSA